MDVTDVTNLRELHLYIQQTLCNDADIRRPAEEFLKAIEFHRNYPVLLFILIEKMGKDTTVGVAASILLKNFVKRNWKVSEDDASQIHDSDRNYIKQFILKLLLHCPEQVQRHLSDMVEYIVKEDFSQIWPTVIHEMITDFQGSGEQFYRPFAPALNLSSLLPAPTLQLPPPQQNQPLQAQNVPGNSGQGNSLQNLHSVEHQSFESTHQPLQDQNVPGNSGNGKSLQNLHSVEHQPIESTHQPVQDQNVPGNSGNGMSLQNLHSMEHQSFESTHQPLQDQNVPGNSGNGTSLYNLHSVEHQSFESKHQPLQDQNVPVNSGNGTSLYNLHSVEHQPFESTHQLLQDQNVTVNSVQGNSLQNLHSVEHKSFESTYQPLQDENVPGNSDSGTSLPNLHSVEHQSFEAKLFNHNQPLQDENVPGNSGQGKSLQKLHSVEHQSFESTYQPLQDQNVPVNSEHGTSLQNLHSMEYQSFEPTQHSENIPIGIFWDLENCTIPRGSSAVPIVHEIRKRHCSKYIEKVFYVPCDTTKVNKNVLHELYRLNIRVMHVSKDNNSADIRLIIHMVEFISVNKQAALILISGDQDFSNALNEMKKNHHVILYHLENSISKLKKEANECHLYSELLNRALCDIEKHELYDIAETTKKQYESEIAIYMPGAKKRKSSKDSNSPQLKDNHSAAHNPKKTKIESDEPREEDCCLLS